MTQDQRSTPVRSLSHVRQKEENGCIVASLAMLTGKTYDEVRADSIFSALGDEAKGASFREVEEYLFRNGFAWQEVYRCGPPGNTLKPEWPCAPWADMHICEVRTGQAHAVVLLRDGTVLDPLTDEPKRLTDYAEVYSVRAVYRIASEREERFPLNPTKAMIEAGAQRLVRWEDGCEWPGSWSSLDVRAARNDAERVWRSMWLAANEAAPREKPPSPSPVPLGNWPKEVG